jgi:hypothetical protein
MLIEGISMNEVHTDLVLWPLYSHQCIDMNEIGINYSY